MCTSAFIRCSVQCMTGLRSDVPHTRTDHPRILEEHSCSTHVSTMVRLRWNLQSAEMTMYRGWFVTSVRTLTQPSPCRCCYGTHFQLPKHMSKITIPKKDALRPKHSCRRHTNAEWHVQTSRSRSTFYEGSTHVKSTSNLTRTSRPAIPQANARRTPGLTGERVCDGRGVCD